MPEDLKLSRREIGRLVHNWIGVDGGYLGDFTYAKHDRFWLDVCDKCVDTSDFPGTTRECFEATLFNASESEQAAVLRAILDDFPLPESPDATRPKFRSAALRGEILGWISRLETGRVVVQLAEISASEVVRRALDDANALLRTSGPLSAVDRVHTAMHGYLHHLCDEVGVSLDGRPTMNQQFKALRRVHPAFSGSGVRSEDVDRILGSMASILDALNPVRNNASVAHPNAELLGNPEAHLVINAVRTLLNYFEDKRRQLGTTQA